MPDKKLFLLDAYALIFRAYYALIKMPRLTQDGFNTSAVFGFVNTLEEVLRKENPSHIAVCFDPHGPTFRSEADETYKAQRESMPEDIRLSVPVIKEILEAYDIPVLEVPGFEADDVIGTMAKQAEKEGFTTYMMTPDKDFGQLVSPSVLQYKPAYKGQDFEIRGEKEVCAKYGINNTHQVIDLLALMGDTIDNIPGCPGVGEKTAVKLIAQFGDIENLLANTSELKGALRKKVEDNAQKIRDSYFLATIRTDVPIDRKPSDLIRHDADIHKLYTIFDRLEFRSLKERVAKRLSASRAAFQDTSSDKNVSEKPGNLFPTSLFDFNDTGDTETQNPARTPELESMAWETAAGAAGADTISRLSSTHLRCGICIIAHGDNDMTAVISGASIAFPDGRAFWINASDSTATAAFLDILSRPDIEKISSQTKREWVLAHRLRNDGETPLSNFNDISLMHYLLQPEMRHSVDVLASSYMGHTCLPEPDLKQKRGKPAPSPETLSQWACEQAYLCLPLATILHAKIEECGMGKLYSEVELPLTPVLAEMEITGVRIDVAALGQAASELEAKLSLLEKEIFSITGEEFNVGSPAKVGEILFDKMGLDPKAKRTKTGQYSTSEDVLEKIAHKSPAVGKILEYRQLKKLLTTYLTALPAAINPATGRVHTVYNQTVTATGRISSSSPNLQNIPVREEQGREIRRAFIASEGNLFLSADYSQIELRLVADFAHDPIMLEAFRNGDDIHAITAAKIHHTSPQDVTPDQRRHAKTANFGILYGISAFGLASRLGIPRIEAKELIDNYFNTFPTIRKYMSDSVEHARENGFVKTLMGRRRLLPDINSKNPVVRGYAERNAINAPVQGTAADIIKKAMVAIAGEMKKNGLKSKMTMQVHDELNFDVVPEELPLLQQIVTDGMEGAYSGEVKLTASSGVALNWLDAH